MGDIKNIKNYEIIRREGRGAMDERFHAKDQENREYTIIVPNREKLEAKYQFVAYEDEATIDETKVDVEKSVNREMEEFKKRYERVIGLSHPNTAEVYNIEFDEETNAPFVVMEYVKGNDIFHETKKLSPLQMISLFVQLFEGLEFIHDSGFLHLNIKPERVKAHFDGKCYFVKLTDFGFAIPLDAVSGELKGTPSYIAPEVALELDQHIGPKADFYSAGVLMYYCLTRQYPFPARMLAKGSMKKLKKEIEKETVPSPTTNFNSDIPAELDKLVMDLISSSPDARSFESAQDVVQYFYKYWADECKEMPFEGTLTVRKGENE